MSDLHNSFKLTQVDQSNWTWSFRFYELVNDARFFTMNTTPYNSYVIRKEFINFLDTAGISTEFWAACHNTIRKTEASSSIIEINLSTNQAVLLRMLL